MISDQRIEKGTWVPDHPLFRAGTFRLPSATGQAGFQDAGYYNPVVDSLILEKPAYRVWQHETTHRVFSLLNGGCFALRGLAGISHSLILALIHTVSEQGLRLSGRRLGTLRAARPHPSNVIVKNIVISLKTTEDLFDRCYWSLVPVAEIAAIDFQPGDGEYGWLPWVIEDTKDNRERKDKQINDVAARLAKVKKLPHEDIREELFATWEAFTSIKCTFHRRTLLNIATSAILEGEAASHHHSNSFMVDRLAYIRDRVQDAQKEGILKDWSLEWVHLRRKTRSILGQIWQQILGELPQQFHRPTDYAIAIDMLISSSPPYDDTASHRTHPEHELVRDPHFGLLNYWFEPGGRHRVLVNRGYLHIVENRLLPVMPVLGRNWWRELALFETLRLAIKEGKPVICPFLHWEGVTCSQDCPIRKTVIMLQKHTELVGEEAVCTLSKNC